jgi:hypothetical protein
MNTGYRVARNHALTWMLAMVAFALQVPANAQTTSGNATTGATLYVSKGCNSGCHGPSLTFPASIANAINAGGHITYANTQGMGGQADTDGTQYRDIAAYFATLFAGLPTQSVTFQTARAIAVPNLVLNTIRGDYISLQVVTQGSRGSASAFTTPLPLLSPISTTYTPGVGQCGADSFTYEAFRASPPGGTSNLRTVSVNISNPAAPIISTGATSMSGTVGVGIATYFPANSGGTPLSYSLSGSLPTGLNFNSGNGQISGTPSQAGTFNVTLNAFNCSGGNLAGQSGSRAITISIAPGSQTITFGTLANKLTTDPQFVVSATGGASGIAVMFTASGVCGAGGTNGSTITLTAVAGLCTVTAAQAGNANYLAAPAVMQSFTVSDPTAEVFPPNCVMPPGWIVAPGAVTGWGVATDFASTGSCSLKSNPIVGSFPGSISSVHGARVQITANFNAGTISVSRKVSSEPEYKCFRVLIDGVQQGVSGSCVNLGSFFEPDIAAVGASGELPFTTINIPISAGTKTVVFSYDRDSSNFVQGSDAAWIDSVLMPLSTSINSALLATGVFR